MRILWLFLISLPAWSQVGVLKGKVTSLPSCSDRAMVWVSLDKADYKDRLLLIHTEVPVGGTFQVHLKPGDYQIRASDKLGCEALKKISMKNGEQSIDLKLEKK